MPPCGGVLAFGATRKDGGVAAYSSTKRVAFGAKLPAATCPSPCANALRSSACPCRRARKGTRLAARISTPCVWCASTPTFGRENRTFTFLHSKNERFSPRGRPIKNTPLRGVFYWPTRKDSNLRPSESESDALSSCATGRERATRLSVCR